MESRKKGLLYLIPSLIGSSNADYAIPRDVIEISGKLKYFIVENERSARRYLKLVKKEIIIDELKFLVYDEHTHKTGLEEYLTPALNGNDTGLLSEAGCPAVADPGSEIVRLAHAMNIRVVPLTGPSSVVLALMASGLNGQNFLFTGYLPVKRNERIAAVRKLEQRSVTTGQTQIFIETPYRNNQLLSDLLSTCQPSTFLCIASELTTHTEFIMTQKICDWTGNLPDLNKKTAIFLIGK